MFFICIKSQISELLTCIRDIKLPKKNYNSSGDEIKPVELSYLSYDNFSPPLIIMHGLFGSKSNWRQICRSYSARTTPSRKIIVADARNHGNSPHTDIHTYAHLVADLKLLLDRLSIKKTALLGHSMGGRACMLFSLKYPNLVERLIVADISPTTDLHMASFAKMFDILQAVKMPFNVPLDKAIQMIDVELKPHIPNGILRAFVLTNISKQNDGSINWRVNLPILKENLPYLCTFPLDEGMKYEGPTLFVAGTKSDFVPKSDFPKILKYFPKAELKYIDGATHWLHRDKPTEFRDITLEFLNRTEKH